MPSKESSPPAQKHSGGPKGGSNEERNEASGSGAPSNGGNNGGSNSGGTNEGQSSRGQKGEGAPKHSGSGPAEQGVQKAKPINTLGEPAGHTEESSSSPLVPILIAIAVLAAISIGAFYYRQRRQGAGPPDSPASPKAS